MSSQSKYCFLNGEIIPQDQAKISVSDIGLTRGYGIYDGIAVHAGKPFRLKDHLERLRRSADGLSIHIPYSDQNLAEAIQTLIEKNSHEHPIIKIFVTGGETVNSIEFNTDRPTFIITCENYPKLESEIYEQGAKLITYKHTRILPQFKTLNYITAVMVQKERKDRNAIEVLFVSDENILECSTSNIFIVKYKKLITPHRDVLLGITRKVVIEMAEKEGIEIDERTVTLEEMLAADEVFITSSFKEIVPIVSIDEKLMSDGKVGEITKRIMKIYENAKIPY